MGGGARRRARRRSSSAASRSASSPRSRRGTSRSSRSCPSSSRRCSRAARSWSSRRRRPRSTPTCWPSCSQRPAYRPASSTSWPPAARSASTWSPTRASTRSRSPARRRPAAGSRAVCGEQLKRVSLELGGKSAAIVLDDADLAATMEGLKFTALMNSGQACVAQTRILASRANYDEVVDALAETVAVDAGRRPGRPGDRDRPDGRAAPAGAGREVHRARPGGGRPRRPRRQRHARRALDQGWYVRPDGLRRRRQRDADRPGGDLRPGAVRDPVRRRGRRRPDRQRLRLRPGRHRVDRATWRPASTSPAGSAPARTA